MRAGMSGRGVWFAGEHTAAVEGLGTVSGAWGAGEGVARGICGGYGIVGEGEGERADG